ncbi:MAG: hypothetical protein AAFX02_02590 [Pseudomonadota bacterium]
MHLYEEGLQSPPPLMISARVSEPILAWRSASQGELLAHFHPARIGPVELIGAFSAELLFSFLSNCFVERISVEAQRQLVKCTLPQAKCDTDIWAFFEAAGGFRSRDECLVSIKQSG